jgi:hypothetical protein
LTDLVDSKDGFSDDESHSFDAEEFMSKGLSFAGQVTKQLTVPPTIHMWDFLKCFLDCLENKWRCASQTKSTNTKSTCSLSLLRIYRTESICVCWVSVKPNNVVLTVMTFRSPHLTCISSLSLAWPWCLMNAFTWQLVCPQIRVQHRSTILIVFTWTLMHTSLAMLPILLPCWYQSQQWWHWVIYWKL